MGLDIHEWEFIIRRRNFMVPGVFYISIYKLIHRTVSYTMYLMYCTGGASSVQILLKLAVNNEKSITAYNIAENKDVSILFLKSEELLNLLAFTRSTASNLS
ncbi:hypothetical protein QTP88_014127 [Uroleucon formosanum]